MSEISSLVTKYGPIGPNVSCDLPLTHCPIFSICHSLSLISFIKQYPKIWSGASFSEIFLVSFPITMPSSTSQSNFFEFDEISTSSFGPLIELVAFIKTIGSDGTFAPVSAAWSE